MVAEILPLPLGSLEFELSIVQFNLSLCQSFLDGPLLLTNDDQLSLEILLLVETQPRLKILHIPQICLGKLLLLARPDCGCVQIVLQNLLGVHGDMCMTCV